MTRLWLAAFVILAIFQGTARAQGAAAPPPAPTAQEPPEEDLPAGEMREYAFNPLQALKELKVGEYYFKKGSFRAAARRFEEALKWDPNAPEAYLRLGDACAKQGNNDAAREAYEKFLKTEPESKQAAAVRKKLTKIGVSQTDSAPAAPATPRS